MALRVAIFALSLLCLCEASIALSDPETESDFSLSRYMGTWYQIAFIPNRFQAF